MRIEVWVCPDCGNYVGSSNLPDLSQSVNRRSSMRNAHTESPEKWGEVTGTKAECPDCRAKGKSVQRQLKAFFDITELRASIDRALEKAQKEEANPPIVAA